MERSISCKDDGYFGCLYAEYLKAYYPKAYEQFINRADYIDLLKKYNAYCHEDMTLMLELLRTGTGICSRKVLQEGLQQELYDFIIKGIKGFAFEELTDPQTMLPNPLV